MTANRENFLMAVPDGNLADIEDRWKWIDDGPSGSPNGIIGAWKAGGIVTQLALVSKTLKEDALRFTFDPPLLPKPSIQVNDDLDTP